MKSLIEYAELAWNHSFLIDFESNQPCPADMFTKEWVERKAPNRWCNKGGWYWILTNASLDTLRAQTKIRECQKALDITQAASFNVGTLPPEILCSIPDTQFRVVYNGTHETVFSRLRNHTATTDQGPYSIGLNLYPDLVRKHRWSVCIFHIEMIDAIEVLANDEKRVFKELVTKHARSRVAVEMAWRMRYGWPLLNRKGLEDRKATRADLPESSQEDTAAGEVDNA
ncbi:hypothetical protein [Hyalangium gracile]|uniref:hypothetical protein n=1 Tax=Hyalangium gracile TaxID=394092 RepID=UPI001CC9AD4E|nr:hypothetical protein [Hyalangium gracile]